ncbi:WD40 repeat-like protein, partial [Athelia psychrophila]
MLDPATMDAASRPQCLDGTRTGILQSLIRDLTSPAAERTIIWLYGVAGSGKSTITTTISEQLHDRGQRGAFLFFDRNSPAQSGPNGVIRTLAHQLALSNGVLAEAICDAIKQDPQIATRTLDSQFKALVMTPLRSCAAKMDGPVVVILDAFDECGDAQSRRALVHLLITNLPLLPYPFRFLITGRPELDLNNAFGSHPAIKSVPLGAAEWSSAADVLRYIQHEIDQLYQARRGSDELPPGWPGKQRLEQFGARAADSFIWAATGIRYLCAADDLDERLDRLLSQQAFSLGDLYATALRSASNWDPNEASPETCRRILGAVVVGRIPLTDDTMDSILGLESSKSSRRILRKLGCLLQWSEGLPVRTLHASFADYLTDARMCGDQPWFIDESRHHHEFTIGCLRVMERLLRFNICGLPTSYLMNRDVQDLPDRVKTCIPQSLAYACRFWSGHLIHINTHDREVQLLILEFFQVSFLYWLEVLSLIGEGRAALCAMVVVRSYSKDYKDEVRLFAKDGIKFVSAFAGIISDSAPHIYLSALPFAPSTSIINHQYSYVIKNTLAVTNSTRTHWPSCEQVIEGHTDNVRSVAFSPDGERIASGSYDQTIRIWDARTGKVVAGPFWGHTDYVRSVALSPDGERVASGSNDQTIRVWDVNTGKLIAGPFNGHTNGVSSIAFSPNGELVVSGSYDQTIRVWDSRTGELVAGPFNGHSDSVGSVTFSPDGKCVASGSYDKTVRICDARTGKLVAGPFTGHTDSVSSVAFSPDGGRIASGSGDKTICIWDAHTGTLIAGPFKGHADWVRSVTFSPDGERVASGSQDRTVRIWDARAGKLLAGPFTGHASGVSSVAMSPDGEHVASGADDIRIWDARTGGLADVTPSSGDQTMRIWDARTGQLVAGPFKGHTDSVSSVTFSPDGERVASGSKDKTIRVWDARTGKLVVGWVNCHTFDVASVTFSPDNELIASSSGDKTICIWDARTGKRVAGPFKGHTDWVRSVTFSPDGKCVASGSQDRTIRVWDTRTGDLVAGPFEGHTDWVISVAFSPDGKWVASGSKDQTIRIWNACTGELLVGLINCHTYALTSVAFSPDGERVVSGSYDKTIRIWDTRTGQLVAGPFKGHTDYVSSVVISPDGERVVSGSNDKTIRIWNARTGKLVAGPFKGHNDGVTSVFISPDGERFVSGSKDKTIRIFNEMPGDVGPSGQGYTASSQLKRGWMQNSPTELLFWVPPTYRTGLWRPNDVAVIAEHSTRLDLTHFVHGENWAQCHV